MGDKSKISAMLFLYFVILFCLISCASSTPITITRDRVNIAPPEKKIPLKVGLYLSEAFRTSECWSEYADKHFIIGEGLSDGVEKMVRDLFQEVIVIDKIGNTQDSPSPNYDIIITPKFKQFTILIVRESLTKAHWKIENTIAWSVTSPDGKEIYQNTIQSDEITTHYIQSVNAEIMIESIKDQLQKAQQAIYSSGWWEKTWWKGSN
jgi:hypothetical protein